MLRLGALTSISICSDKRRRFQSGDPSTPGGISICSEKRRRFESGDPSAPPGGSRLQRILRLRARPSGPILSTRIVYSRGPYAPCPTPSRPLWSGGPIRLAPPAPGGGGKAGGQFVAGGKAGGQVAGGGKAGGQPPPGKAAGGGGANGGQPPAGKAPGATKQFFSIIRTTDLFTGLAF